MNELNEPVFLGTAEELKIDLPDKDLAELFKVNCLACSGLGRVAMGDSIQKDTECQTCDGTGKHEVGKKSIC